MFPTITEIETAAGNVGLHTYGMFILLAFCSAFILTHYRALRIGLHPDRLLPTYLAAAVGGLAGGRLLYSIQLDWDRFIANPLTLFQPSGFAVYGGVIGGAIAVAIVAIASGIRPWKLADIAGPSVLLGMGVGRFACFFAGCCHGAVAGHMHGEVGLFPETFQGGQVFVSAQFPFLTNEFASNMGNVSRIHDVPLYPTQLWSACALLTLCVLLSWKWEHRRFDGQIAALTLMLEPFYRIFVESFRADERGYAWSMEVSQATAAMFPTGMTKAGQDLGASAILGITTSQGIGLASMVAGIVIYLVRMRSGVAEEIPVETSGEDDIDDSLLDD